MESMIASMLVIFGVGTALYHLGVWRGRTKAEQAVRKYGKRIAELDREVDELGRTVAALQLTVMEG